MPPSFSNLNTAHKIATLSNLLLLWTQKRAVAIPPVPVPFHEWEARNKHSGGFCAIWSLRPRHKPRTPVRVKVHIGPDNDTSSLVEVAVARNQISPFRGGRISRARPWPTLNGMDIRGGYAAEAISERGRAGCESARTSTCTRGRPTARRPRWRRATHARGRHPFYFQTGSPVAIRAKASVPGRKNN